MPNEARPSLSAICVGPSTLMSTLGWGWPSQGELTTKLEPHPCQGAQRPVCKSSGTTPGSGPVKMFQVCLTLGGPVFKPVSCFSAKRALPNATQATLELATK